ncbi:MAG: hypothetical protein HOF69_06875 [Campylobacteraceae bacterium]|nr:hypothetical protein [Campylobacteraceae bacterium]MBT3882964.1 hypothetical protein [Campylobacteraceae bacterium]MBT4030079.1 hypothetical protein [Campylobacteraceae bacterium]MBT4179353.1 hypothetical protein [Campylobacteraceae bacterium]MBT4572406.1 hypothetical protein [Campylobacteraceae bacterium]
MSRRINIKKSFTLIETIFALTIISIMIGGFFNLYKIQVSYSVYNELQVAENEFLSNTNLNSIYESKNIKLVKKIVP